MNNLCPICGFRLNRPPIDCDICPCCGTQFGYSDSGRSHTELRDVWINSGTSWHSQVYRQPRGWNPWLQLLASGHAEVVPDFVMNQRIQVQAFTSSMNTLI